MARRREVAVWGLLAAFGLVLASGLVEIGVRVLHLVPDRFWEPDSRLGMRHVAGMSGWWTQEEREFLVPVRINRQGLRDVDHGYEKPPGSIRILILGDSFIEAMQVPLEHTVGRRLQGLLGADAEVISAGFSGYGTASELLFWEQEGVRYDPDVVVLAMYPGNDVKNNSPTLEDLLQPVYDGDARLQRVKGPAETSGVRARGWQHRSRAYQFTRQLVLRQPWLIELVGRLGLASSKGPRVGLERHGVPIDYWVFAPEPDTEWSNAWWYTERLLGLMHEAVSTEARRFVMVVVPSRYEIYPAWWEETVTAHPAMRGLRWDVAAPGRRLSAWCRTQAVLCLDLVDGLREASHGEPLYFHHDGHWTEAGHREVARLLADFLGKQKVIPVRG